MLLGQSASAFHRLVRPPNHELAHKTPRDFVLYVIITDLQCKTVISTSALSRRPGTYRSSEDRCITSFPEGCLIQISWKKSSMCSFFNSYGGPGNPPSEKSSFEWVDSTVDEHMGSSAPWQMSVLPSGMDGYLSAVAWRFVAVLNDLGLLCLCRRHPYRG